MITTPLLCTIGIFIYKGADEPSQATVFFLACVVFGLAYSLIPFLMLLCLLTMMMKKGVMERKAKLMLTGIAESVIALLSVGWDFYKSNIDMYTLFLWLPYSAVLACAIWFYRINPFNQPDPTASLQV